MNKSWFLPLLKMLERVLQPIVTRLEAWLASVGFEIERPEAERRGES